MDLLDVHTQEHVHVTFTLIVHHALTTQLVNGVQQMRCAWQLEEIATLLGQYIIIQILAHATSITTVQLVEELSGATGVKMESVKKLVQDLYLFLVKYTVQRLVLLVIIVTLMRDVHGVLAQFNVLTQLSVNVSLHTRVPNANLLHFAILVFQILNVLGAQILELANNKEPFATLHLLAKTTVS